MPVGPITPGSPVTVTPDVSPAAYTSIDAPTATMGVVAADIQALTLALLNVQARVMERFLDKIDGGTVSGPMVFTDTVDFQATGANRPVFQGGIHVVAGGIAVTAGDVGLSNGSLAIANDLTVGDDALIADDLMVGGDLSVAGVQTVPIGGELNLLGSVRWRPAIATTNADHSVGKVSGDSLAPDGADTIIVPPGILSANHDFIVRSAGAKAGNRMRFYSNDNAFYLFLKQDDGTGIAQLKSTDAFGFWSWILLEHNGSANGWFPIGGQKGF